MSEAQAIENVEVTMHDGSTRELGVLRSEQFLVDPPDPSEPMTYKGVEIEESHHGNHVELQAEMTRELDDEELAALRDTGHTPPSDGTMRHTVRATGYNRQDAALEIEDKIDEMRELGYR